MLQSSAACPQACVTGVVHFSLQALPQVPQLAHFVGDFATRVGWTWYAEKFILL
jgi:hypothetical protein